MPQDKRRRKYGDIDQVLGLKPTKGGKYGDIDEVLQRRTATPPAPQSPGIASNVITGLAQFGGKAADAGLALSEAIGKASLGDFGP